MSRRAGRGWKRLKAIRPGRLSGESGRGRETEISKREEISKLARTTTTTTKLNEITAQNIFISLKKLRRTSLSTRNKPRCFVHLRKIHRDERCSGSLRSPAARDPYSMGAGIGGAGTEGRDPREERARKRRPSPRPEANGSRSQAETIVGNSCISAALSAFEHCSVYVFIYLFTGRYDESAFFKIHR